MYASRKRTNTTIALLLGLVLLLSLPMVAAAEPPTAAARQAAIGRALDYMRSQQQADGSFTVGFGSDVSPSTQVLMAAAVAGADASSWRVGDGPSLLDYLAAEALGIDSSGAAGRLSLAVALAGLEPRTFGGTDLVAVIWASYDAATGSFDPHGNVWNQALAMWGLAAAGEPIPPAAMGWLVAQQNEDGGWGWAAGQPSDSNSTALAVQALAVGGPAQGPAVERAVAYLEAQATADGGYAYDLAFDPTADANSTALAVQALLAAGRDPLAQANGPIDVLLALQGPGGGLAWQAGLGEDLLATAQAVPALAGVAFPPHGARRIGSAATPLVLAADASHAALLMGDRGGSHAYYRVDHPGTGEMITVTLVYGPIDVTLRHTVTLQAYGADGRQVGSARLVDASGRQEIDLVSAEPSTVLVQVSNYASGLPLALTLSRD